MASLAAFFDIGETLVQDSSWLPGAKDFIDTLRADGQRVGLISNTGALSRAELSALLPNDFSFDQFEPSLVLLSSEVGIEKPDPRIFLHAVAVSGTHPWDCVFVGERLLETWAAQAVGMRAIRVARFPQDFVSIKELLSSQ